jgi:hypothetical protein
MAEDTFDDDPRLTGVEQIDRWRWPVFFPLGVAIRRKVVTPIGIISIPPALRSFPIMRSGNKKMGWLAFTEIEGVRKRLGPATDPSMPIYKIVKRHTVEGGARLQLATRGRVVNPPTSDRCRELARKDNPLAHGGGDAESTLRQTDGQVRREMPDRRLGDMPN